MPRAEIATTQAKFALEKLHAELGGQILDNKREAKRLAQCMKHVEAFLSLCARSCARVGRRRLGGVARVLSECRNSQRAPNSFENAI
jgi:hypothetical protein